MMIVLCLALESFLWATTWINTGIVPGVRQWLMMWLQHLDLYWRRITYLLQNFPWKTQKRIEIYGGRREKSLIIDLANYWGSFYCIFKLFVSVSWLKHSQIRDNSITSPKTFYTSWSSLKTFLLGLSNIQAF